MGVVGLKGATVFLRMVGGGAKLMVVVVVVVSVR
jgi:hypothetical protein